MGKVIFSILSISYCFCINIVVKSHSWSFGHLQAPNPSLNDWQPNMSPHTTLVILPQPCKYIIGLFIAVWFVLEEKEEVT